jgi:hypothetical protein
MNAEKLMRQEVKKYIDTADVKVVKMMHAMLEVDADNDWLDTMPNNVKADVEKTKKSFAIAGNPISDNEFKSMIEDAEKGNSISLKESKKIWTKRRKALEKITP